MERNMKTTMIKNVTPKLCRDRSKPLPEEGLILEPQVLFCNFTVRKCDNDIDNIADFKKVSCLGSVLHVRQKSASIAVSSNLGSGRIVLL